MNSSVLPLATCAAALATLATFAATDAKAATRFGIACVHNQTGTPINFAVKIGEGGWTPYALSPGANRWFTHRYDSANENSSPAVRVRFDSDLRSQRFNITYKLTRRAATGDSCREGKSYAFQYEKNNRSFIDLKAID